MDNQKILGVTDGGAEQVASIMMVPGMDDRVILEAMKSVCEGETGSAIDRLSGIIADRILRLRIKNGAGLVLPAASHIRRTLKTDGKEDATLVSLRELLNNSRNNAQRMIVGLRLGDRGLQFAAGHTGNRHIRRVMSSSEIGEYARHMALTGYNAALLAAECTRGSIANAIKASVPALIERFSDAARVISFVCKDGNRD